MIRRGRTDGQGAFQVIKDQKVIVVMPAYNAEKTLLRTYEDLPHEIIDEVVIVDDQSQDGTIALARRLKAHVIQHERNQGYGGNQKTCYRTALGLGADIVVMVHPDYQYSPKLCGAMAWMIASDEYDMVLASRILGGGARSGRMPWWRYIANRSLTLLENILLGTKYSEFHTGYRAYSRKVLQALPLSENSDDFVFDNQVIAQAVHFGFRIGEVSCPTRYMEEASSINFQRSVIYGFGVLGTAVAYRMNRMGFLKSRLFSQQGRRLDM